MSPKTLTTDTTSNPGVSQKTKPRYAEAIADSKSKARISLSRRWTAARLLAFPKSKSWQAEVSIFSRCRLLNDFLKACHRHPAPNPEPKAGQILVEEYSFGLPLGQFEPL